METKFSEGPWEFEPSPRRGAWIASHTGEWAALSCGNTDEAAAANAHLIAAAPDLYAACAEFVRKVDAGEAKSTNSYRQMKAALSRARGD